MSDSENFGKNLLVEEIRRINTRVESGFKQIHDDLHSFRKDLENHIDKQVEIPSQAIRMHEEMSRNEKNELWKKINAVYNGQTINTTKLSIWSGVLSVVVSLVTAIVVVYIKTIF